MTTDRIVSLLGLVLLAAFIVSCTERRLEPHNPVALERHIFAVRSDGGGEEAKLDKELLFKDQQEPPFVGGQGTTPLNYDDPCRPTAFVGLKGLEQLQRQFVCTMRNAATFHTDFIKRHPERGSEPLRIAFYFNGGLNSPDAVRRTAEVSWRRAEADGIYPIYMIWPTGGFEAWREDTTRVRNGRHLNEPHYVTGAFHVFGDVLSGLGRTPDAWTGSFEEFANAGYGLGSPEFMLRPTDDKRRVLNGAITAERNVIFSDNIDAPSRLGPTTSTRGWGGYVYFASTSPFRALSTPLVVGFGHTMWENMVRRTRTSIRQVAEFPGPELDPDARKALDKFPRGAGGFASYFHWLESCIAGGPTIAGSAGCPLDEFERAIPPDLEDPKELLPNARIDMIGHSMGAIVVNELLETFPNLPYENVVYMGAAASIRETQRAIKPVLLAAPGCTHFFNLSLHPMNEARESTSAGFAVSGSLLVWVDEMFERPKTLPDRTIGQWRNVRMVKRVFPPELQSQMLFKVFDRAEGMVPFGNGGDYPNPTTHGAFNDEGIPFWNETFWKPENIRFREPDADCKELFASRLVPAAIQGGVSAPQEIMMTPDMMTPEEMAGKWSTIWRQVEAGKTVALTSGGHTVARIVPVPGRQEDSAGMAR
jgi:hypothetical protein